MRLLSKEGLRQIVLEAVRSSSWQALELDASDAHPFRLRVVRAEDALTVRVYIWNLTHGGGLARPPDEYRIQVTGVDRFEQEPGGHPLILGRWGEAQVFAACDPVRHLDQLGESPSIQVRESALRSAYEHGLATHTKGNGEIAVAFRPDLLMHYVQNQQSLHGFGESDREVELLNAVAADPTGVPEADLRAVAPQRRSTILTIRSLLRDRSFPAARPRSLPTQVRRLRRAARPCRGGPYRARSDGEKL